MTSKGREGLYWDCTVCHTANLFICLAFHLIVCSSIHPENGMKMIEQKASSLVSRPGFCSRPYYPDFSCISRVVPFLLCASVFSKQK